MKCDDIHEIFGVYWDLPAGDPKKELVDEHISSCPDCAEEFDIWLESTMLIRSTAEGQQLPEVYSSVTSTVMSRIYEDEAWRVPVGEKLYQFSHRLRRNAAAAIVLCVGVFLFAFFMSLNGEVPAETVAMNDSSVFGRIETPVVLASGAAGGESMNVRSMPTAVASLKGFNEPFMYQVGPIHTVRDYMLFLSLLGLTATLLTMNWLLRTKT